MPIEGISNVDKIPRIGKIRLGIKVKGQKGEYPKATDYFVFDPDDESVMEEIRKVYGEKPKAIDIMFASEDSEVNFPQYLKRYSFGTLICRGDGKTGTERLFEKEVRVGDKQVECAGCKYKDDKCHPLASLMVLLPKIPGIGVWQLDTGSYHSIVGINAGIKLVKTLYKRISGVPLRLLLNPKQVTADGRAKTVYVLSLSMEGTLEQALKSGVITGKEHAKELTAPKVLLPEPDEEEVVEPEVMEPEVAEKEAEKIGANIESEFNGSDDLPGNPQPLLDIAKQLGYPAEVMTRFLDKFFAKQKSKDLTEGEVSRAVKHCQVVKRVLDVGLKAFDRPVLEEHALKVYHTPSVLELNLDQLAKVEALMIRSTTKKEGEKK